MFHLMCLFCQLFPYNDSISQPSCFCTLSLEIQLLLFFIVLNKCRTNCRCAFLLKCSLHFKSWSCFGNHLALPAGKSCGPFMWRHSLNEWQPVMHQLPKARDDKHKHDVSSLYSLSEEDKFHLFLKSYKRWISFLFTLTFNFKIIFNYMYVCGAEVGGGKGKCPWPLIPLELEL